MATSLSDVTPQYFRSFAENKVAEYVRQGRVGKKLQITSSFDGRETMSVKVESDNTDYRVVRDTYKNEFRLIVDGTKVAIL